MPKESAAVNGIIRRKYRRLSEQSSVLIYWRFPGR